MLKARPSHCLRLCDWKGQQRAVGWPGLSSPTCTSLRPFSLSSGPSSVQLDDVAQLCHRPPMGMTRNWYETRRILETEESTQKSHVVYSMNSATEHQERIYLQIAKTEQRFSEVTLPHMVASLPASCVRAAGVPHWGLSPTCGCVFTGDVPGNRI